MTEPESLMPTDPDRDQPGAISRSEAVRRTLAAGFEDPRRGTAYILKEFGIEISLSHFSAVLATERKKGWARKGKPGRKPKVSRQHTDAGLTFQAPEDGDTGPIES